MESRQIDRHQGRVITVINLFLSKTVFKDTGIQLNEEGICAGLVARYLIKKGKGQEPHFFADLGIISTLKTKDYKKRASFLAKFCRDADLAFRPDEYTKYTPIDQGDLVKITRLKKGLIEPTFAFGAYLPFDRVEDLFRSVIHKNQMIYLGANKHAVGIYKKYDRYYLFDPNNHSGELSFSSINDFTQATLKRLFVKRGDKGIGLKLKSFRYIPAHRHDTELTEVLKFPTTSELADLISTDIDPNYNESLFQSVAANDMDMAKELIKRGANPLHLIPSKHLSPLNLACMQGHPEMISMLLESLAAIPDDQLYDPLILNLHLALLRGMHDACQVLFLYLQKNAQCTIASILPDACASAALGGNLELLQSIFALDTHQQLSDPNIGNLALNNAVQKGHRNIVAYLLMHYPLLQKEECLSELASEAIKLGHDSVFKEVLLYYKPHSDTYLQKAILYNRPRMAQHLLHAGAQLTLRAIKLAAEQTHLYFLTQLLMHEKNYNEADAEALHAINLLIQAKPCDSVNELLSDNTFATNLLRIVLLAGNKKLVTILHAWNVHLHADDKRALVCLKTACKKDDIDVVLALLDEGIDPLPLLKEMTLRNNRETILLLLQRYPFPPESLAKIAFSACYHGYMDILEALRQQPIDFVNLTMGKSLTLLKKAYRREQHQAVLFLLKQGANPDDKFFLFYLCKRGETALIRDLLVSHPHLRETITQDGVLNCIQQAAEKGIPTSIEPLLCFHTLPQDQMNAALTTAREKGHAAVVDELMKQGAQLTEDNYTAAFYQAYGLTPDLSEQSDLQILQLAHLHGHQAIYHYVCTQRHYLDELKGNINHSLRFKYELLQASLSRSRLSLFHYDPKKALENACILGDLGVAKHLIEDKHLAIHKNNFFYLDLAAANAHKGLVELLMAHMTPKDIMKKLYEAIHAKHLLVVTSLLEAMPFNELTPDLLDLLKPHQFTIYNLFMNQSLYRFDAPTLACEDATMRLHAVTNNENALAALVHAAIEPTKSRQQPLRLKRGFSAGE